MIRRKEIFSRTVTSERITLRIAAGPQQHSARCHLCGRDVEWLSVSHVAAIAGVDRMSIADLVSRGDLDIQVAGDHVLICRDSLTRWIGETAALRTNEQENYA